MKKIILSITLIMSLLITSCSTSGGTASSKISETTTAITTTTEETTTTEATTTQPKQAVCSLADLCDLMASALGKELDESSAFLEEALGTNFIFTKTDRHEAGEDGYEKTTCFSYYDCDIVADGYQFITIQPSLRMVLSFLKLHSYHYLVNPLTNLPIIHLISLLLTMDQKTAFIIR